MGKSLIFTTLFSVTFLFSQENVTEWKEFSKNYTNNDYTIRDDIDYFELRDYLFDEDKQLTPKYLLSLVIYRKKLRDYPPKLISSFQHLPFLNAPTRLTDIGLSSLYFDKYLLRKNGFFIKKDNSLYTITEKQDITWVFDKIDTEAELFYFLNLYELIFTTKDKVKYREKKQGYEVKMTHYTEPSNLPKNRHSITKMVYLHQISSLGKYSKKRILNDTKIYNTRFDELTFTVVPAPPLAYVLENHPFVTPLKLKD